ncbi:dihydrolipoyl dehydrogenase [Pontibacillus marinus]|uniref:Dihydrolipoyl dehydrogenase n=1 Tax=Pontibacillus marinus BH030004 = DSM 16465 TaxID=1385511 RepID=A0A0A5G955_9BACI|nr:dihydrolipoyl dehydrogenase [Pontibacillus marinus]KGX87645.1 dihydrolipoamide dehydrogenase [Pontibacillus marinus BH030004 = DSM 16465]
MVVGEIAEEKDVVIIGGGPGGYNAAINAAQHGFRVTLIEKEQIGGICLNEGCIPSKVYTTSAKKLSEVPGLSSFGIDVGEPNFSLGNLQSYRDQVVTTLRKGVEALCKKNKIEMVEGHASFLSEDRIGVDNGHQFDVFHFNHAIVATGSRPRYGQGLDVDHKRILDSRSIFHLEEVPEHLIVYGSDYIALEVAMSYHQFGSKVSLVLDGGKNDFDFDSSINKELGRLLKKQKIKLYKSCELKSVENQGEETHVSLLKNEEAVLLEGSHAFISLGHQPNTEELGIDRLKMDLSEEGHIKVDKQMRTSISNIYAIGDVTEGAALAVKAIKQSEVVSDTIAGKPSEFDGTFLPTVVHSIPPIASVGLTEEEAKDQYGDIRVAQFGYGGNGYATVHGKREGFIKYIVDDATDLVLGFHGLGEGAVELVSTGTVALEMVARDEDLKFPHYPHPSFNESISLAEFTTKREKVKS